MIQIIETGLAVPHEAAVADLIKQMVDGHIEDIRPVIDISRESGVCYPQVEPMPGKTAEEVVRILDSLAAENILETRFYDRLIFCPVCGSLNLRPSTRCPKCSAFFADEEAKVHCVNSYILNRQSRNRIAFDMGSRAGFSGFLKRQGYEVFETVKVSSKAGSGVEQVLDMLARRSDGFMTFFIGIGVVMGKDNDDICMEDAFRFDNQVSDLGIHDKVLLAMPSLNSEARQFARRQRIKAFDARELGEFLDISTGVPSHPVRELPFKYEGKAQLLEYLRLQGYRTEEKARIPGRSGVDYTIDIMAYFDDGLFTHTISIGILTDRQEVGLAAVSVYDANVSDIGIHDKILLVSPALSGEARQFAEQQRIKIIEVSSAAALA